MELETRARRHAALGDQRRLSIVDQLACGDLTVSELAKTVGMKGNVLAHHLEVLETAGLIDRRVSEGDHRRRYVSLRAGALPLPLLQPPLSGGRVAFVCTHNSARSQFAAALWREMGDSEAWSAGSEPAEQVHPLAVLVAADFGLDIAGAVPSGYDSLPARPDLLISVCDRAKESGVPHAGRRHHWSIPDPVTQGTPEAFRSAFDQIATRIEQFLSLPSA